MFRLLNVPPNHVLGNGTSCPDVVAILPQPTSPEIPLFDCFAGPLRCRYKRAVSRWIGHIRLPVVPEHESLRVSLGLIWFPDSLSWKYVVEFGRDIGSRFERLAGALGNQFA